MAPMVGLEKRAPERAEAVRAVAAMRHVIRGAPTIVSEKTLRDWVRLHGLRGPGALIPGSRGDKGKARVLVTREWDAGIDLPLDRRAAIAARSTREARSMVGIDGTSIRETLRLCSDILCRRSAGAGSAILPRDLRGRCQLNIKGAERIDLGRYRLHHRARKDHKTYQDRAVGRASLALADRPMSLLQGDVHHADIAVQDQAQPIRLRLIAHTDMSSLFLWATPVLLSKGRGIVQADVAEALAHLTMSPHGGIASATFRPP